MYYGHGIQALFYLIRTVSRLLELAAVSKAVCLLQRYLSGECPFQVQKLSPVVLSIDALTVSVKSVVHLLKTFVVIIS